MTTKFSAQRSSYLCITDVVRNSVGQGVQLATNYPPLQGAYTAKLDVQSGFSQPNYAEAIRKQLNASTSYSREVTAQFPVSIYGSGEYWNYAAYPSGKPKMFSVYGDYPPGSIVWDAITGLDYSSVVIPATSAAVSSFRSSASSSADVLPILGEIKDTIKFLSRPATSLAALAANFYKKKFWRQKISLHDHRKHVHDAYLEFTFAANPLLGDVRSIAEALAEQNLKKPSKRSSGFSRKSNSTISIQRTANYGPFAFKYRTRKTVSAEVTCAGAYLISLNNIADYGSATLGFDLAHVIPALWEITPFSFVIDYVTNINEILNATLLGNGNTQIYANTSTKKSAISEILFEDATLTLTGATTKVNSATISGKKEYTLFNRNLGIAAVPSLYFSSPVGGQIVNLGALASAFNEVKQTPNFIHF